MCAKQGVCQRGLAGGGTHRVSRVRGGRDAAWRALRGPARGPLRGAARGRLLDVVGSRPSLRLNRVRMGRVDPLAVRRQRVG